MAPMTDSGIAKAAAGGCFRVAKSCGVTVPVAGLALALAGCEVDVAGRLETTLVPDGSDCVGFGRIAPECAFEEDGTACDETVADASVESGWDVAVDSAVDVAVADELASEGLKDWPAVKADGLFE